MIGQGNYGCVYRPDVKNKDDKVVSKIVLKHNIFNLCKIKRVSQW